MRTTIAIVGLASLAFLLSEQFAAGTGTGDYKFETSEFMQKTAYRKPDHIATDIAPSGAESRINIEWDQHHTGKWFIEQQRYGGDAVDGGIAKNDPAAIDRGLKILHWGFEQQQPDGSFNCPDSFHSMSFFVESAAHACLMLQQSPDAEKYSSAINWMKPRLLKAAKWMTQPSTEEIGRRRNLPYTHRRYLVAAALGETGVLCDDQQLVAKSREYIREGIGLQDPSGFNPEKGGSDTSYHSVGLYYAERYYDLVADDRVKEELRPMLKKGNDWLKSHIKEDGLIDTTGNTRTGAGQELSRNGVAKTINYGAVYRGFYHWYLISGDPEYERLAERVFHGEDLYKHQIGKS